MGTWYLTKWIKNHPVNCKSDDLCTHPVQSKQIIRKSVCAIYEGCQCLINHAVDKRVYTCISYGAVPSLTGGYYNCAEGNISRKRKWGGKYTSFGPVRNILAVGGGGISSPPSGRKRCKGGRRFKVNRRIVDTSAEEHQHPHHQGEGGQRGKEEEGGRSEHLLQSPGVGRKAIPWKAKRRRRGVVKDSLVQSRLENFVKLYPNLSIRGGGFVTNRESAENSEGGCSGVVQRGVKRGNTDL